MVNYTRFRPAVLGVQKTITSTSETDPMGNVQLWIGVGFTAALAIFFMAAYFVPPATDQADKILRVLASLLSGAAGAFLSGGISLQITGELSTNANWAISATGGVALFVAIWFSWSRKLAPDFRCGLPAGITFEKAVETIGKVAKINILLEGFTPAERAATLASEQQVRTKTAQDAVLALRSRFSAIRPYAVVDVHGGWVATVTE